MQKYNDNSQWQSQRYQNCHERGNQLLKQQINITFYFVMDVVQRKEVELDYIPGTKMVLDLLYWSNNLDLLAFKDS